MKKQITLLIILPVLLLGLSFSLLASESSYSWDGVPNIVRSSKEINVKTGRSCRNWTDICTGPVLNSQGVPSGVAFCAQNPNTRKCPTDPNQDNCDINLPSEDDTSDMPNIVFLSEINPEGCNETADSTVKCLCSIGRGQVLAKNKLACDKRNTTRRLKRSARVNCRKARAADSKVRLSGCNSNIHCRRCGRSCSRIEKQSGYDSLPHACNASGVSYSYSNGKSFTLRMGLSQASEE